MRRGAVGQMDPLIMQAGSALVGAMASDAWQHVSAAVGTLWRRAHPTSAEGFDTELGHLRHDVLNARSTEDTATEEALAGVWRLRFQDLADQDSLFTTELRTLLKEVLIPALASTERTRIGLLGHQATATDHSWIVQGGGDVTLHGQPPRP